MFFNRLSASQGNKLCPSSFALFLYFDKADSTQQLLRKKDKKLAISFNSTFRNIDDTSLNNTTFGDYVERIYPIELEIKNTTDTVKSASYLDLHLENEDRLKKKLYDKRDDFSFPIVNFQFLSSNIPAVPAYGVM